jgi:tetratricopeptide (TPR) repeat protein
MMIRHTLRRLALTLLAATIAAVLLRTQLSSALVTRGDALAYWGLQDAARSAYEKALFFDPRNGVATDRFGFSASMTRDSSVLRRCVSVASRYLTKAPGDAAVLMDRALCFQHQRSLGPAIRDFCRAGKASRDARAYMFAALDERALHRSAEARQLLEEALAVNPQFLPARRELART